MHMLTPRDEEPLLMDIKEGIQHALYIGKQEGRFTEDEIRLDTIPPTSSSISSTKTVTWADLWLVQIWSCILRRYYLDRRTDGDEIDDGTEPVTADDQTLSEVINDGETD